MYQGSSGKKSQTIADLSCSDNSDALNHHTFISAMGEQERVDLYVLLTMILCGANFCVW